MRALLIVCPIVFLGALIDSIAGGGGLITLPAYYLAGLPAHVALGTNKLSSSIFTTVSVIRFGRQGGIHLPTALTAGACALAGSALGSRLVLFLSERVLQWVLVVALPLIAVVVLAGRVGDQEEKGYSPARMLALSGLTGLVVGAYDGFFGPGAGTFYILGFLLLVGHNLKTAMGNAKVVNLASNLAALATLGSHGKISLAVGLPAAACGVLGSYIGAGLALKRGAKIFRPMLVIVMGLLVLTLAWELASGKSVTETL